MARAVVQGFQGEDMSAHDKLAACAKRLTSVTALPPKAGGIT